LKFFQPAQQLVITKCKLTWVTITIFPRLQIKNLALKRLNPGKGKIISNCRERIAIAECSVATFLSSGISILVITAISKGD